MDTTNTPLRGDPTPQKRRSESEHNGGLQRKSSRTIQVPSRYKYYALMTQVMNIEELVTYEQAKNHDEWKKCNE